MQPERVLQKIYSGGDLARYTRFPSVHITPRTVDIWLPPGYGAAPEGRYPVIYMHDGQNLFEPALAYTGLDWGMDEALARLMAGGVIRGAIVVGVWNSAQRTREYMPARPLLAAGARTRAAQFSKEQGGMPLADGYLRFLVEELKPFVDAHYRTLADQANTFVMGSSMGGLLSLYAISSYPAHFGGAACLSTHWPIGGMFLVDAMAAALPSPASHRLYFDYGTATLDALYEPFQQTMDAHLEASGYRWGQNWITRKFEGAEHTEAAWRARVEIPLRFLLAG